MNGFDIIGDIHGQARRLETLLRRMGYVGSAAGWRPPQGRHAVFVGDLIDRGPEQVATCRIVRSMVDSGHAHVVLGNHEFNAIGYALPDPQAPGRHLRPRTPHSEAQHRAFLQQVGQDSPLHAELVGWFRTLPLTLELGRPGRGIRVVHAWWDQVSIDRLRQVLLDRTLSGDDAVRLAFRAGSPTREAIERLMLGREVQLPVRESWIGRDGEPRTSVRVCWWHGQRGSLRDLALLPEDHRARLPDMPLPSDCMPTRVEGCPVFVGHYWLAGTPRPLTPKVACVDWSASPGSPLVAYRWDGEMTLDAAKFVTADLRDAEPVLARVLEAA